MGRELIRLRVQPAASSVANRSAITEFIKLLTITAASAPPFTTNRWWPLE